MKMDIEMWSLPTEETPLDSMPVPNLIPQGGGAVVGSIPRAPDPAPPERNIITRA
jgi:hypothetical protein